MSDYIIHREDEIDELIHYGVKGMKWGVRRAQKLDISNTRKKYDSAKAEYKSAKKEYNKSFNKAYNRAVAAYSPSKKHRQANDARWEDAYNKANKLDAAKLNYKTAKAERKKQINDAHREINKNTKLGSKLMFNDATRKKAAKYVVDNNMSIEDANKRAKGDALRNTAAFAAIYGGIAVASIYKVTH